MVNKKQQKANSSKNHFCPIFSWKKARKDAFSLLVMMQYFKVEERRLLTEEEQLEVNGQLFDELGIYNDE